MAKYYHSASASPDDGHENSRNDGVDELTTTSVIGHLPLLPDYFGLSHQNSGVTLIAIDFEHIENIGSELSPNFEVGLAILDIRNINSAEGNQAISTYNFITGDPVYQQRASQRFLFGKSVILDPTEIKGHIQSLIPWGRQAIFIGHDIINDLRALDKLQLNYAGIGTLDTFHISRNIYPHPLTLRRLLLKLDLPYSRLHCGGNDANFTLRALLLLAVNIYTNQPGICQEKLAIMKQIALSPLPQAPCGKPAPPIHQAPPVSRASERRTRWRMNSRKYQSKSWDLETQERIRAERAVKRQVAAITIKFRAPN